LTKVYSEDLRERVFQAKKEGMSTPEICSVFNVSHDFVSDMISLYRSTGSLKHRKRGGYKKPLIDGENLDYLKLSLEANNDMTLKEIQELFKSEKNLIFNKGTISSALKRINFSLKKRHFMLLSEKKTI
jgi:transposase